MKKVKTFEEILSRAFSTIECDPTTGDKKETIIDGHSIVTGHHYLAPFEIKELVRQLRLTVNNKEQ